MTITSVGDNNWNTPDVILRAADKSAYAVVRCDNYGWSGDSNTFAHLSTLGWTLESDWDWDNFKTWINGSTLVVTVKNYGTGKADVLMDFTKGEETHHQYYKNISVTADDLYFNLTFENCNVTFAEGTSSGN